MSIEIDVLLKNYKAPQGLDKRPPTREELEEFNRVLESVLVEEKRESFRRGAGIVIDVIFGKKPHFPPGDWSMTKEARIGHMFRNRFLESQEYLKSGEHLKEGVTVDWSMRP